MKRFIWVLLLAAVVGLGADSSFAGKWTSSQSDAGGDLQIGLEGEGSLTFTLQGQEVKAKVQELTVSKGEGEARKFRLKYSFKLGEYELLSVAEGTVREGKMDGKYETSGPDGSAVDRGTIQASAAAK